MSSISFQALTIVHMLHLSLASINLNGDGLDPAPAVWLGFWSVGEGRPDVTSCAGMAAAAASHKATLAVAAARSGRGVRAAVAAAPGGGAPTGRMLGSDGSMRMEDAPRDGSRWSLVQGGRVQQDGCSFQTDTTRRQNQAEVSLTGSESFTQAGRSKPGSVGYIVTRKSPCSQASSRRRPFGGADRLPGIS